MLWRYQKQQRESNEQSIHRDEQALDEQKDDDGHERIMAAIKKTMEQCSKTTMDDSFAPVDDGEETETHAGGQQN